MDQTCILPEAVGGARIKALKRGQISHRQHAYIGASFDTGNMLNDHWDRSAEKSEPTLPLTDIVIHDAILIEMMSMNRTNYLLNFSKTVCSPGTFTPPEFR